MSLTELINDMKDTLRDAHGAGLAAPQIGVGKRVCLLEVRDNPRYPQFPTLPLTVLINPVLTLEGEGTIAMYEGCLSVPGIRGRVKRPRALQVAALDLSGRIVRFRARGVAAAIVQHEVDHLDGVLFIDKAESSSLCFLPEYDQYVLPEDRIQDTAGAVESNLELC